METHMKPNDADREMYCGSAWKWNSWSRMEESDLGVKLTQRRWESASSMSLMESVVKFDLQGLSLRQVN